MRALLAVVAILAAGAAPGQDALPDRLGVDRELPVALIADEVRYDAKARRLVARGSVQVFHGGRTLTTGEIVYDATEDRISIPGPFVLRNPDGSTLYAEYGALDADLRDGLLASARAVLAERFRIAAAEAQRVGGRYNVLGKAVFSTCDVCLGAPVPLWRIRARRVIHDELERMIYYEDATFDVAGQPVLWLPVFRHPDPTLERASGLLLPQYISAETFGQGLKLPYYWVIDDQTDATVTPFPTTSQGLVMEAEFRRRFRNGSIDLTGAITFDEEAEKRFRGRLIGEGHYSLTDSLFARFDLDVVSDDGFLTDFEYSDVDRLTTQASLGSWRRDGWWELGTAYFQSLRADEPSGAIPFALPEFELRETWGETFTGGVLGLTLNGVGLKRTGGQDVIRGSAILDWDRTWTTESGLVLRGFAETRLDAFRVWDSTSVPNVFSTRITPLAGIEARFPLVRSDPGATHILEPIAQFIWSEPTGDQSLLPNEDSLLVEFDETNLFDISRFPGSDLVEPGFRANVGLRYERLDTDGWSFGLAAGRVLRAQAEDVFAGVQPLASGVSDYLAAATLRLPPHLAVTSRVLLRDDFALDRNELRLDLAWGDAALSGTYVYLSQDFLGGALDEREEMAAEASWQINDTWRLGGRFGFDLSAGQFVEAGGVVTWSNECAEVDFSLSRRFTSSFQVDASTSFGIQLRLAGFGSDRTFRERESRCTIMVR